MEAGVWSIFIPVRPKAVQSVRAGNGSFFPDPKVRKWKNQIRPFIEAACKGRKPSKLPMQITSIVYMFKAPQGTPKNLLRFIKSGGIVPYIGCADITDNLAKGLVDTCAGLVFENDKMIWHICDAMKVYGLVDGIKIVFEETPDVVMIDGKPPTGGPQGDSLF
jgi:Holliday junction resolvase RusA-like endonuclease